MQTDFYEGQILLIDKAKTWTSFDVVNKVRMAINKKFGQKLKVGHNGTLDPLASGLLMIFTGKMTKKINEYSNLDKEYIAKINFGATTPSYDKETEIDNFYDKDHITLELLKTTIDTFIGKQMQLAPIFSAKKIDGKKACESARKGKSLDIKPVEIEIKEIEILENNLPESASLRMLVGKGTYIRSFAFDLGKKLNSGAYLGDLRRTKIGNFSIDKAQTTDAFVEFLTNLTI